VTRAWRYLGACAIAVAVLGFSGCAVADRGGETTNTVSESPLVPTPSEIEASDNVPQAIAPFDVGDYPFVAPKAVVESEYPMNTDGTAGSGCHPPNGETLPDGIWFGDVIAWSPDAVTFDLVCSYHWTSDELRHACEGKDDCEYFDVNNNSRLRVLPVSVDAQYVAFEGTAFPLSALLTQDAESGAYLLELPAGVAWGDEVWVFVNGGSVTQFQPRAYP
jgi:hypothetical protein